MEDVMKAFDEMEKEYWGQRNSQARPYLEFLKAHTDMLRCAADAALYQGREELRDDIRDRFYAAFTASDGWKTDTDEMLEQAVPSILPLSCQNPEECIKTTYGKILSDVLSEMRIRVTASAVRATLSGQVEDLPLDDYERILDDLNQEAWKILAGTSAKAVHVLADSNEALAFVGYDGLGFGSLMAKAEDANSIEYAWQ